MTDNHAKVTVTFDRATAARLVRHAAYNFAFHTVRAELPFALVDHPWATMYARGVTYDKDATRREFDAFRAAERESAAHAASVLHAFGCQRPRVDDSEWAGIATWSDGRPVMHYKAEALRTACRARAEQVTTEWASRD